MLERSPILEAVDIFCKFFLNSFLLKSHDSALLWDDCLACAELTLGSKDLELLLKLLRESQRGLGKEEPQMPPKKREKMRTVRVAVAFGA